MCNILIFAKENNSHPDPTEDWKKFKAGDVIDIAEEDDFFWGNDIDGDNPLGWWIKVKVKNVSKSKYLHLLESEEVNIQSISFIDKENIPHQIRSHCVDINKMKSEMDEEEFNSCIFKKENLFDPQTIG